MKLKLDKIIIDQGTQARVEIDQKTVTEYSENMMNGDVFPPLTVFYDGIKYYLVDGFHRYFAYKNTVAKEVEVEVHNGTLHNAFQFSLGVNSKHGRRRTNADKKNVVMLAFNDFETSLLSLREIAKLCDVSHSYVASIKEMLDAEKEPKKKKPKEDLPLDSANETKPKSKQEVPKIDEEDDELNAILAHQKDLEEENAKLQDKLALKAMDATPEEKALAKETIDELREENVRLQRELDSMTISRNSYMKENAEMKKQLAWYKKQIQKQEKVSA